VFDPGLGVIPMGKVSGSAFSSVVMGSIFARTRKSAQKQTAQENPRRIGRTYSGRRARVKEKLAKKGLNPSACGLFALWPGFTGPKRADETNRFPGGCHRGSVTCKGQNG
jgi:hypothetical protein